MFFVLLALWFIFNGKFTLEVFLIGAAVCAAIYFFCVKFLGYAPKRDLQYAKKSLLLIQYAGLLIAEIFKANLAVIKFILGKKKPEPVLVSFKADLQSDAGRVLLSHSITLTPGTITVELMDNHYMVHCLDKSMAQGMENSCFVRLLKKIEGVAK